VFLLATDTARKPNWGGSVIYVVYAQLAVLGTSVHLWRHPADRAACRAAEVALIWWLRDRFLLAVVIVAAISLWGDAYGHIHQAAVNDNHDPDNTGPVLYTDILFPLVAVALYAARERLQRGERAAGPTASPSQIQP
jgi:hypothetical protein